MNKIAMVLPLLILTTACAGGFSYDHVRSNGSILRVENAGATGLLTSGSSLTEFWSCDLNGQNCVISDTGKSVNPSAASQLVGAGATAYGAHKIGEGIEKSGDTVNNSSNSESSSKAGASATGGNASGGCQGNCGGGW